MKVPKKITDVYPTNQQYRFYAESFGFQFLHVRTLRVWIPSKSVLSEKRVFFVITIRQIPTFQILVMLLIVLTLIHHMCIIPSYSLEYSYCIMPVKQNVLSDNERCFHDGYFCGQNFQSSKLKLTCFMIGGSLSIRYRCNMVHQHKVKVNKNLGICPRNNPVSGYFHIMFGIIENSMK